MSKNMCLQAVGVDLQFGQTGTAANAQIRGTTVGLEVRTPDLSSLDNIQVASPLLDADAATKGYVDAIAVGLSWKAPVRACTVVALPANTQTGAGATLTADVVGALPAIDGVALVVSDRLLVREEGAGTSTKNGIYEVTDVGGAGAWVLTRTSDALVGSDAASNAMFCEEGTIGADTAFVQTEDSPVLYNTNATTFLLFSSVVSGVTAVADAAGITGVSLIDDPNAPVPKFHGAKGEVGVLSAAIVGTDVVFSVVTGGIATIKIADDAVTNAKFAPNAATSTIRGTIVFGDASSTVAIGTVPASSLVTGSRIRVVTPFTNPCAVTLEVNAVSRQASNTNDVSTAGQYDCDDVTTDVGAATAVLGVSAGLIAGEAEVSFDYIRFA